jgi:NADH-ubiquinone oxidoreductase chain 2
LSLRGIPPLTGFIPKWITIYTLCQTTPLILIIIIIGAIINIYFYINILFNSLLSININTNNSFLDTVPVKLPTIIATLSISLLPIFIL